MKNALSIISWGCLISFMGSLPPGHMTIAASYIAGQQGADVAWVFASGTVLAEMLIVRFAVAAINRFTVNHKFFLVLELITAVVLFAMTAICFYSATQATELSTAETYSFNDPFTTGFLISITNPIHFPFWIGWSVVLMNKGILIPTSFNNNLFVAGIASGSLLGYAIFIYAGEWLMKKFSASPEIILIALGFILFIVFILQIRNMILTPASVRYTTIFNQRN
jgi:threonine/homoserine/homoserine lactone efflux protein